MIDNKDMSTDDLLSCLAGVEIVMRKCMAEHKFIPQVFLDERADFRGRFCRQAGICWGEEWPRVTCRSCLHSTPEMHGNAAWSCARFSKPISIDEQKESCPAHLHIPDLVPGGEQIDVDEENETVTYKMPDGSIWKDGESDESQ